MQFQETELTPELAARLLANSHPKQRRPAPMTVQMYARAIREGRWRLVADPILIDRTGHMFNGGQRCAAVIAAHRSIPIMISWDADADIFDIIDAGRPRSAYQFIGEADAKVRASAARVTLWYERRFEQPPSVRNLIFDLHEVIREAERRLTAFDAMMPSARATYNYSTLAMSICLGAYAIAFDFGYQEEVEAFVAGLVDPHGLAKDDPALLLSERFRKRTHRQRRRTTAEDWNLLVRALNLHLEGRPVTRFQAGEVWPRVAESEADYQRRRKAHWDARRVVVERAQLRPPKARATA